MRILFAMGPYRVLVVDDHPDTAEVLSVLFHMLGHETRCALRGRDALQLAREMDPDLILLDLGLPDITGYEVIRELRADPRGSDRFIAAVTGHARPSDMSRSALEGFDEHIVKPIDISKIRDVLRCADSHYAQRDLPPSA
jgi:CheY-like chemotaxis protein